MQPETFQDRGGFLNFGHNKYFVKIPEKKASQGNSFFLLDTLKTTS